MKILLLTDEDLTVDLSKVALEEVSLTAIKPTLEKTACTWVKDELAAMPCVILIRHPLCKVLKGKNAGKIYDMMTLPVVITEEQGA